MERVHLMIHGRVQGVFFRANAQKEATRLGLSGWVRNTANGAVEAMAEGSRKELEAFVKWCHHGPAYASVRKVEVSWEATDGTTAGFRIRY